MTRLAWPSPRLKRLYYEWMWNPHFVGPPDPETQRALDFIHRAQAEYEAARTAFHQHLTEQAHGKKR